MNKCSTKCILLKTNDKCADQAGWKKAHAGHYLCCSHATTSVLLMTEILCVAGRRVPLDENAYIVLWFHVHNKRFSLR